MTAKEKQKLFIKNYLKPLLKNFGYKTSGNTWYKDKGEFFIVINLQNYSWNSKEIVDFRFNIGFALKALLKDSKKTKATYGDLITRINEADYIPHNKIRTYCDNVAYKLNSQTNINEFSLTIINDFEKYILPKIDEPKNLKELVNFHDKTPVWGDNLKRILNELQIVL